GMERVGGRHARYVVRDVLPRVGQTENRILLRRVRAAYLGADLLGRPGRARRGPLQSGVGLGRSARGRRLVLYQRLLGPAAAARRLAGGRRRAVRRGGAAPRS